MTLMRRFLLIVGCGLLLAACSPSGSSPLAGVPAALPGSEVKIAAQVVVPEHAEQNSTSVGQKDIPGAEENKPGQDSESQGQKSDPAACPVTLPNGKPFHPPEPYPAEFPYPNQFWYGSEKLWAALPKDGTWSQLKYGEKVFIWRVGFDGALENKPQLALSGRRLDGPAPEARSDPPATNAFHEDFYWAMLHGFQVPTPGCWEITASYAEDALTFVEWVP